MKRNTDRLPKVPRRMKQVSRKFIHQKPLTPKERRRLIRWMNARRRDIHAPPLRPLPDGRYSLLEIP